MPVFHEKDSFMADTKKVEEIVSTEAATKVKIKQKEEPIELEGTVVEAVKGKFRVEIPASTPDGKPFYVMGHIAGKLRRFQIKIVQGDRVKIEISPYDLTRGRIVFRLK